MRSRFPLRYFIPLVAVMSLAPAVSHSQSDSARAKGKPDLGPMRRIEFDVTEGTWTNVDVSPDGRTILFDLLGDIYTMPIAGGAATPLLSGRDWDQMPRYSPDGKWIAFVSDRDGNMNLWVAAADGSNPKQLTKENRFAHASPAWARDGTILIRRNTRTGAELWSIHPDGGNGFKLPISGAISGPAVSPDGRFLYIAGIRRFDRLTGDSILLGEGVRPKVSPDGKLLAYLRTNDNLTALHLRDLRSGEDRRLIASVTPMANGFTNQDLHPDYAFTPDGRSLVMSIHGKISRVDVATGAVAEIPMRVHVAVDAAAPIRVDHRLEDGDLKVRVLRWPSLSPDGKRLVFSAVGKLYAQDVPAGGTPRRLTSSTDFEYTPAYSPDGKWIAYTTWTDTALGHVMLLPANGGMPRRLTTIAGRYANPTWSRDGTKLAFSRGGGVELRGGQPDNETYFDLVWVPVESGESEPRYIASTYASRVIGFPMRYYPVIAFNSDGSRLFYSQWGRSTTPGDAARATLYSVRLDGTDKRAHIRTLAMDEIVPSPDAKQVAFVFREQVLIAVMPPYPTSVVDLNLDAPALPVKKLTTEGGNYVTWFDSNTVTWSMTNHIFRQRLDAPSGTAAERIAEVSLTVPRLQPTGAVAFTNARLVTMKGDEVIRSGTVVVEGNRITGVGPSARIPAGARRIDASGKTIIPGLIDVHAHLHYQAFETFPRQKWDYIASLAYGVTTTFDPSAHNLDVFSQQEMVEAGEMMGPRILSTGDVIYGDENVFPIVYENIKSIDDARTVVKRFKAYDPTMLKQYMQPRRDQRQWLAQAARENGVMITAEGGGDLVLDLTMVADGYSAVEHAFPIAPLHQDVIEFVRRSGTHYTPTLIVGYGGPTLEQYFSQQSKIHDDVKLRRFTPEDQLDRWRRWQYVPDEEWHWMRISESAAKISQAGGLVTMGAHGQRQGLGAHWELWGLQMGGMTNLQALQAATIVGARKIGFDRDLGSLEAGKLADFLVLDANPLDNVRNTTRLKYTVKNGIVYDAESMTELWPNYRPIDRFFWQSRQEQQKFAAPSAQRLR